MTGHGPDKGGRRKASRARTSECSVGLKESGMKKREERNTTEAAKEHMYAYVPIPL